MDAAELRDRRDVPLEDLSLPVPHSGGVAQYRAGSRKGRLREGTRRDASISVGEPTVRPVEDGVIEVAFSLPGGAYATAVMRELMKTS